MKKTFCFSLIVMFLALAGLTPVRADDVTVVTPYVDSPTLSNEQISNLENASLLLEYLRNGGTIDVKNVSSDYSADDLLSDFGNFVKEVVGDIIDIINPFQTEVEYHGLQPIGPAKSAVMQFMGALPFYALSPSDDTPVPTPDINYQSYIDTINGSGFYFKEYPATSNPVNQSLEMFLTPNYNYSFCATNNQNTNGFTGSNPQMYLSDIISVYINPTQNNNYTVNFNVSFIQPIGTRLNQNMYYYSPYVTVTDGKYFNLFNGNHDDNITYSFTGSLEGCFQYLAYKFRNINIYVNGDLWAYVGNTTNYQIEISTGTTVPIKDGTGKVEWLYDYEIYFDIDRIQDDLNSILWEIRNTPNTPTIIKFDDLQDVIVDVNNQPAIAVKVLADTRNIDQIYIDNYGPIIPAFLPLFTPVIDDVDIIEIADTAVSPIPSDLLEVFGYMFMGVLFVGFIHRLLE